MYGFHFYINLETYYEPVFSIISLQGDLYFVHLILMFISVIRLLFLMKNESLVIIEKLFKNSTTFLTQPTTQTEYDQTNFRQQCNNLLQYYHS